mmetsp:Transcript_19759/g.31443  ORF Transcript_19759/g.31443 Transcript_19759/m.31443 type:complete len:355 (+) Transcript_19759:81-1145(+)
MAFLPFFIAFVVISLAGYYWYKNNQLTAQIKDASQESTSSSHGHAITDEKFLDFDKDCTIRALRPSDMNAIRSMVTGKAGTAYFLDHSLEPFLASLNHQYLGFGVELKESGEIIATQFIMMVDNNHTALVFGAMVNDEYLEEKRIIYMRLSNEVQAELTLKFEHLAKYRCVEVTEEQKRSYINSELLDWKIKFNLDSMGDDNAYYVINGYDDVDGLLINGDFKECEDMQRVVDVLQNKCKRSDVLVDWRLFQVQGLKEQLVQEVKHKKLSVLINEKESGVLLVYGDHDYYVYGAESKDILSGVRFALSQNSTDNLGLFVCKAKVDQDEELKKVFHKALHSPIIAMDYDMHIDGH